MNSTEVCPEVKATRIYEVAQLKRVPVRVFDSYQPGESFHHKCHKKLMNLYQQAIEATIITFLKTITIATSNQASIYSIL